MLQTTLFFLQLFRIAKVMLTDHAVEDGNVSSGPGENDEKKEQGKKVSLSALYFILLQR